MLQYPILNRLFIIVLFILSNFALKAQENSLGRIDNLNRKQGVFKEINSYIDSDGKTRYLYNYYNYIDNEINGLSYHLDDKGDTTRISHFQDNLLVGQTIYYSQGKISRVDNFVNGLLDGESKIYRKDGTLYQVHSYKDGEPQPKYYTYCNDGIHIAELIVYNEELNRVLYYETFYISGRVEKHIDVVIVGDIPYYLEKEYSDDDEHKVKNVNSYIPKTESMGQGTIIDNRVSEKKARRKCWKK